MSLKTLLRSVHPRQLFLLDSLGALLTAFMLGVILVRFEHMFGMPRQVLYALASIAFIYSLYSFVCFSRFGKNWRLLLKIIAIGNLIYGCLSMGLVIFHFQKLSVLGLGYFAIELLVILVLAKVELQAVRRI